MRSVLGKVLRERRRALLGWSIGLLLYQVLVSAAYPFVAGQSSDLERLLENYPDALLAALGVDPSVGIASPAGYLDSQSYAWLIPLLFTIFAAGIGARVIAGEEEAGTLELLLSAPVSRVRVLVESALGMIAATTALGLLLAVIMMVLSPPFDLTVGPVAYLAASVGAAGVGLVYGAVALLVGAWTGRRSYAVAATGVVAVAGYLIDALAALVDAFEPLQVISPFHYYRAHRPLIHGFDGVDEVVLYATVIVLVGLAALRFRSRDLRTA